MNLEKLAMVTRRAEGDAARAQETLERTLQNLVDEATRALRDLKEGGSCLNGCLGSNLASRAGEVSVAMASMKATAQLLDGLKWAQSEEG